MSRSSVEIKGQISRMCGRYCLDDHKRVDVPHCHSVVSAVLCVLLVRDPILTGVLAPGQVKRAVAVWDGWIERECTKLADNVATHFPGSPCSPE